MLRLVLCGVVAVGMAVGLSEAKESPKNANGTSFHGHFVSFSNGTLTIASKKHGQKSFQLSAQTRALVWTGSTRPQVLGAAAVLSKLGPNDRVVVHLGRNGKVVAVGINPPHKSRKKAA